MLETDENFEFDNLQKLMIDETIDTVDKLQAALIVADVLVSSFPKDTPFQNFQSRLYVLI